MILKIIYMVFVSILAALFVGLGIAAFYEQPKPPMYPVDLQYSQPITAPSDASISAALQQRQMQFDKVSKAYEHELQIYNRNVSIIAIMAAILMLILSLTVIKHISLIADGVLLGGVYIVLYSIVRGFSTNDNKFRFLIVTIGLLISLVLGYVKFIRVTQEKKRRK